LKGIIERDYKELTLVLFPGGAWKSTVIMAGSILEAILFDLLGSDPATQAKAMASQAAPKYKGTVRPMECQRAPQNQPPGGASKPASVSLRLSHV
jgi:hypothetical protein